MSPHFRTTSPDLKCPLEELHGHLSPQPTLHGPLRTLTLQVGLANFQRQTTPDAKSIAAIIGKMMGLISIDGDGKRILDYLGPVILEIPGTDQKARELMVQPAYEFVLFEQERVNQDGDPKLMARYEAFRNYFESRLALWGLEATPE